MLYMFDMDDTLIEGYLTSGQKTRDYGLVEMLPGRLERIKKIINIDPQASFAIITNQGGVAFGYNTIEQVEAKIALACKELHFFYGKPFSIHICYHHPKAPDELNGTANQFACENTRRKPNPGMLDEAIMGHRAKTSTSIYVGDLETDSQAAAAMKIPFMYAKEFFA